MTVTLCTVRTVSIHTVSRKSLGAYSTVIGTPGVALAVRNTIIDFTWLTLGAEVRRVVRNF